MAQTAQEIRVESDSERARERGQFDAALTAGQYTRGNATQRSFIQDTATGDRVLFTNTGNGLVVESIVIAGVSHSFMGENPEAERARMAIILQTRPGIALAMDAMNMLRYDPAAPDPLVEAMAGRPTPVSIESHSQINR